MCYSRCHYENYFGQCQKPRGVPCPEDEASCDAFETEQTNSMELKADEKLLQSLGFS